MCIVAGNSHELSARCRHCVIPFLQILSRSPVEICKQEIGITAEGPKAIEEHDERLDLARVRIDIVDLYTVVTARVPAFEILWIRNQRQRTFGLCFGNKFLSRELSPG